MRKQDSHELGGNFFDYEDDQEALIREDEVAQALAELDNSYSDPAFPASADCLYRTPQQPPAGAMPPSLLVWARVSRQEVRRCHSPVTFPEDGALSAVVQGALGDSWLTSALNISLPSPGILRSVLVSDRHRDKGIYTLKLFKEGAWRYVHVDDRLPCWPSGALYFCSNTDPNQIWAPLIEKAFAKLHGCYESLGRGSIEQGLRSLAGAPVLRTPLPPPILSSPPLGGTVVVDETEKLIMEELWLNLKRWLERGRVTGCYRSVEYDRFRKRQARTASSMLLPQGSSGGAPRHTGLLAGRGYGILRACEVSTPATPTQDAVKFKLIQLSCPWGVGQWRGDWSAGSRLWARYPSADAELRQREATEYADAEDGEGREDRAALAGESSVFQSFWMSVEDFATEFSQVLTCVSFSAGEDSKGISRKSYLGRWVPGDPLTGSGGGCTCPTFLQNPFYPVTVQRNSTRVTVCLSVMDRAWQTEPLEGGPAIGYYILRLTGSKPRLTRFHPNKIEAQSVAFTTGCQAAGEHKLDSGRYAVVPVTVKPLKLAESFLLELKADKTVEWELTDDRIQDIDEELRLSDDEETQMKSGAGTPGVVLTEEQVMSEDVDGPPGNKVAEAVHEQIAELSGLVAELTTGLHNALAERDYYALGNGGDTSPAL